MLDFLKVALLLVLLGVGAYNCLRYVIAKHLENMTLNVMENGYPH